MVKINLKFVVAAAAILAMAMPSASFAATLGTAKVTATPDICTEFSGFSSQWQQKIAAEVSALKQRQSKQLQAISSARSASSSALQSDRDTSSVKLQTDFAQLSAEAVTAEQKQSVRTFELSVSAAVQTRQNTVNAAIGNYHNGIDQIVSTHQQQVSTAANAYQAAIDSALQQVSQQCTAGSASVTTRSDFKVSRQQADTQLAASVSAIASVDSQQQVLASTRDQQIGAATQTFDQTINQANAILNGAWPQQ